MASKVNAVKLNKFLNEQLQPKARIEVPARILNLLNIAIDLDKDPIRKKRLQELKSILIGKYPNPQALFNSLRGLKKKLSSLNEAKLKRSQKIGLGLLAVLIAITTLIMPTVKAAASKPVEVSPEEKKVEAPISDVEARILSISVKEEVWDEIYNELQDYLKKLITAEYQGKEAHAELAKIFKKYNISFASLGFSTGAYVPETNKIQLNWNTLMRLARGETDIETVFGTLRHEMAHRAQFEMLKKLLSEEEYKRFLQIEMSRNYVNRIIEVGAHYDEFKRRVGSLNKEQLINYLNKQSQGIIKNIVFLYPDTDPVVKAIYKAQPSLGNLMNKLAKDEDMKKMRIAKEMVEKHQIVQIMVENPTKNFEENFAKWSKRVRNFLPE